VGVGVTSAARCTSFAGFDPFYVLAGEIEL
jgi:hypothetical protein